MVLDTKLGFNLHLKKRAKQSNKTIARLRKFQNTLPKTLITVYKSFIRPDVGYRF